MPLTITTLEPFNLNNSATFTFASTSVTSNVVAGNIKTDNLLYANGTAWSFGGSSYSNTNVAAYLPTYTGNVSANYFIGNGSTLTNITGSNVSGNVTIAIQSHYANIANSVTGDNVSGNVSFAVQSHYANIANSVAGANVTGYVPNATNANTAGAVTTNAQPNITSVGNLSSVTITGNLTAGNANIIGNLIAGNVSTGGSGGNLSGANFVIANYFSGNGSYLTSLTGANVSGNVNNAIQSHYANIANSVAGANVTGYVPNATNANTAGTVTTNAQPNITSVGTLSSLTVTSNVSAGNILTNNLLYANGTAWNLGGGYSNTNVAAYLPTYTGNFTAGNANISGNLIAGNVSTTGSGGNLSGANFVIANYFSGNGSYLTSLTGANVTGYVPLATAANTAGTVTTNAQPNITSVGTLSSLSVTGNLTTGNANITGSLIANTITTGSGTGNISGANYVIANYFSGNGATLTSITGSNVTGYVPNANVANSATTAGTVTTNAQPNITSVGTLSSLSVTSNVSAGNVLTDNLLYANGTAWSLGGTYSNTNVAAYLPTYTGNVSANYFIGNGSQLTGLPASYSNTNVAAYLPTYTGNYTGNNVVLTGNISTGSGSGNISGANYIVANYFSGNGSLLTSLTGANVTGYVPLATAANTTGTVTTNAQPNITSVGTLNGLTITGNVNITGNINATGNLNYANVTDLVVGDPLIFLGANNVANLYDLGFVASYDDGTSYHTGLARDASDGTYKLFDQVVAEPTTTIDFANGVYAPFRTGSFTSTGNITAVNASLGNLTTSNYFSGNGSLLTSITGANVTGYVPNATSANTAGTVTTNAQPNITSVGNLSSLTVTGNGSLGNLLTDGIYYANGTSWNFSGTYSNANVANYLPTYTGNLTAGNANISGAMSVASITTTGSAGNITGADYINANFYIGNGSLLTGLPTSYSNTNVAAYLPTYTGNFTAGNANISGNVSANYFIGNGSQLTGLPASYSNTNVAAYLPTYTGNFTAGNANISGNLIAGNLVTSGSGGNISDANYIIANYFSGNGSLLTSITGSNVSGNVTSAVRSHYANIANSVTGANVSGQVSNALIAGTVYTNAQPNITSTGILTSVSTSGNLTFNTTGQRILGDFSNTTVSSRTLFQSSGGTFTDIGAIGPGATNSSAWTAYYGSDPTNTSRIRILALAEAGYIQSSITGSGSYVPLILQTGGSNRVNIDTNGNVGIANGAPTHTLSVTGTLNVSGNATLGNIGATSGVFTNVSGNGSALSSLVGANVSGNVSWAITSNWANVANSVTGANVTGNVTSAVQSHYANIANSVAGANVSGQVSNALIASTVYTNAQPNITSLGTLTDLNVGGNAIVSGNLIVNGNLTYVNVDSLKIKDPIIELGGGANGDPLTTNDGKDRGEILHYYTGSAPVDAFMGWDNSNAEFAFGSNVAVSSEVVTFNTFGNVRAGNAVFSNLVTADYFTGTLTTASQPNITSVGTLSSLIVTGNITSGNATLGNTVTANYFIGDGSQLTGVAATTAGTVTTNAQPNITSIGNLTGLVVSNSTGVVDFTTSANVTLGNISNLHITGGSANYVIITDGSGNLSWSAQSGGGASVAGSNTQVQFNDSNSFGASANFAFNKTSNTLTVDKAIHLNGANLGSNVSNLYIGGGGVSQILATDGSGNLTWIAQPTAVITVDNFTGNGVQTVFALSTTPANINQTVINYNGSFQLRNAYTLSGANITFTEAPANGYSIEVTTTMGATSGAGAFITRAYTGTGSQANFTVTSGSTVSSVIVTENGIVQAPTADYTISNTTLTFTTAPASNVAIQVRELAIAIATTTSPVYRAYTGNGAQNTFTITSGLTANSLIVAENGIIQRPTTDYSVSGSNVVFVSPPASNVDIQIRELSLNGGMSTGGSSLPYQGGNSGKYLTTDGATASWANVSVGGSLTIKEEGSNLTTTATSIDFVGGGITATNVGNAVTVTVPTGTTRAQAMTMGIIFGG